MGELVKLTVTHEMDQAGSKLIEAVSEGWPAICEPEEPAGDRAVARSNAHWPKGM